MRGNSVVMCWSGGKDSAFALWKLQQDRRYNVTGLLTTLTEGYNRVAMAGFREELLHAQGERLGLPLYPVWIPPACINRVYEAAMARAIERIKLDGAQAVAFGDIYLEDVRAYREKMMAPTGLETLFPNWGSDTQKMAREVIDAGFRATLVCVDPNQVPADLAGREYDDSLLQNLPDGADPCGERGEFHTFVHAAPNFRSPIGVRAGERVQRDGFWFADLLPL
ncbi:MAG: adenine nucleotide alpha hydrolase [Chloroflexi bacterium]|nr:adenine nucleotide alpha hydrolase [Chloroflexota bacterium]